MVEPIGRLALLRGCGLLGPNGAGRTTLVWMLTTLSGTGRVAGFDIPKQATEARRSLDLTGQAATVDEAPPIRMSVRR